MWSILGISTRAWPAATSQRAWILSEAFGTALLVCVCARWINMTDYLLNGTTKTGQTPGRFFFSRVLFYALPRKWARNLTHEDFIWCSKLSLLYLLTEILLSLQQYFCPFAHTTKWWEWKERDPQLLNFCMFTTLKSVVCISMQLQWVSVLQNHLSLFHCTSKLLHFLHRLLPESRSGLWLVLFDINVLWFVI